MAYQYIKSVIHLGEARPDDLEITGSFVKIQAISFGLIGSSDSGSLIEKIEFGHSTPEATSLSQVTSSFFLPYGHTIEAPMCRIKAGNTGSLIVYAGS